MTYFINVKNVLLESLYCKHSQIVGALQKQNKKYNWFLCILTKLIYDY